MYVWVVAMVFLVKASYHAVPEGHVGLYYRGGRLTDRVTPPGMHLRVPLLDYFAAVQVTLQTDKVEDIMCGTKSGVTIYFEKIEVVNRLRADSAYQVPWQETEGRVVHLWKWAGKTWPGQ